MRNYSLLYFCPDKREKLRCYAIITSIGRDNGKAVIYYGIIKNKIFETNRFIEKENDD